MVSQIFFVYLIIHFSIVPKIFILGPPASGRHIIAKMLQKKLNTVLIEPDELSSKLPLNSTIVYIFFFVI
jgi:hypothetical protein